MKYTAEVSTYKVEKYLANGTCSDCGRLPKEDVKRMLKGYKYDEEFDMYFSRGANIGYALAKAE